MAEDETDFHSHNGLRLHDYRWMPGHAGKATVVLLHGFVEHAGRYADVAAALNGAGYAVHAPDHRGHGRSPGDRVFVDSFDQYLADAELYLRHVRRIEPNGPLFILGHSMGGTIAARLAIEGRLEDELNVAGIVLSAPAVIVGADVFPLLRRLAALVGRWLPRLRLVKMGSAMLSRDPEVVAQFQADPLVFHGRFPTRTGAEILRAAETLRRHAERIRLPLLLLQGTGDRVVDAEGARLVYSRAGSNDKTIKLYEGLYHDLLHEPERNQVTADLIDWLEGRVPGARNEA